jgi:hypothetical protein
MIISIQSDIVRDTTYSEKKRYFRIKRHFCCRSRNRLLVFQSCHGLNDPFYTDY